MENVILIGFMGAGKSSIGRLLASRLGASFTDIDTEIEKKNNMTISEMFEKYGESYFREREKKMVKEISIRKNTVIATGGGTVKDEENRKVLSECGFLITLTASVDAIYDRTLKEGVRPLLDNLSEDKRKEKIKEMLYERREIYKNSDLSIDTTELSPMQVVEEILKFLKMRRN